MDVAGKSTGTRTHSISWESPFSLKLTINYQKRELQIYFVVPVVKLALLAQTDRR